MTDDTLATVVSVEQQPDAQGVWVVRMRVAIGPMVWTLRNEGGRPFNWFAVEATWSEHANRSGAIMADAEWSDEDAYAVAVWADGSPKVAAWLARLERARPKTESAS